jgi:hypothetical protein
MAHLTHVHCPPTCKNVEKPIVPLGIAATRRLRPGGYARAYGDLAPGRQSTQFRRARLEALGGPWRFGLDVREIATDGCGTGRPAGPVGV